MIENGAAGAAKTNGATMHTSPMIFLILIASYFGNEPER